MSSIQICSIDEGNFTKEYLINDVPVLKTTKYDEWDDKEFVKFCKDNVKAIALLIADDIAKENRVIFKSRYEFKYMIELIGYAQHMNPVTYVPKTRVHPDTFIDTTVPEIATGHKYDTTNDLDFCDLELEISEEDADPLGSGYFNTFNQVPSISTYKKANGDKGYILYLSENQYDRYLKLNMESFIYEGIMKKDVDYLSVYSTESSEVKYDPLGELVLMWN